MRPSLVRLFPFNANIVSLCAACSGRSMVYSSRKRPRKIQGLLVNLVVAVFAFYAGLTLGTATATNHHHAMAMATSLAAACPSEEEIQLRIRTQVQQVLQKEFQSKIQTKTVEEGPLQANTNPRFPAAISDIAQGMARVDRDDFASFFNLGVPLDPSSAHNTDVLLLYQSTGAVPPLLTAQATSSVSPPRAQTASEATQNCDFMNLVFTDHNPGSRRQCWAIMGQYEAFHVQKYMRIGDNGPLDPTLPLRPVNRGQQANGRKSLKTPSLHTSQQYWVVLEKYLSNLPKVLEQLKPIAKAASGSSRNLIVMVCNLGQAELLLT